jgi:hypothetical protein
VRTALAAFALVFLAAHLPFLPRTLEDIDSINFALGVKHFDVAAHQPHPPGYPVFIAVSKLSTAALRSIGIGAPEPRGLSLWSTVCGTALSWFLFVLYRALGGGTGVMTRAPTSGDDRFGTVAIWAVVIAATSPLFWFTALRPLSDMPGLAAAVAAQAVIVSVLGRRLAPSALVWAGFIAGLAIGIRSQTFLLTLPLLVTALIVPGVGVTMRDRALAVAAVTAGVLAWAIPLVYASGGLSAYGAALGSQAGEDFSGVVMLWNVRSPRVAVDALIYSFLWPWGSRVIGSVVIAVAAAGALRIGWQRPRVLGLLFIGFVPYAIFHLLFHEVVTVRYALPLLVPVAWLAAAALDWPGRMVLPIGSVVLALLSLRPALPASAAYAHQGSPTFRAFAEVEHWGREQSTREGLQSTPVQAIGVHAVARRAAQWEREALPGRVLDAPHGREWLALVADWRAHPDASIAFIADPRRTDLALIEPAARRLMRTYRWEFPEPPFVGGARPGNSDLYLMSPPRWMLDRGWALGAEVAGVTARDRLGPHRQASVAWVRSDPGELVLMLGGRHLGGASDPAVRVSVRANGSSLAPFDAARGFFFKVIPVPAGTFASHDAYVSLEVTSASTAPGTIVPVALEQFDIQPKGHPMIGVAEGWHEPEYNPVTARAWRWTSERSTMWIRPVGRDVTLVLDGESPLRYFDSAPVVTVTAAGRRIARFSPTADWQQEIVIAASTLDAAQGRILIETDKWFAPGDRDGSGDKRHLALRIYSFSVK